MSAAAISGGGAARNERSSSREWGNHQAPAPSPRAAVVLGIDPGGRWTGLAARSGDTPLWASMVTRQGNEKLPGPAYLGEVVDEVELALQALGDLACGDVILAVEAMVIPKGYRITSPAGLLGPAMVLGALLGYFDSPVLVPPGKHGQGPRQAYPRSFWGRQEKAGTGRYRHIRSAWDIAAAGLLLARES